jgi:hypothetical protein
MSVRDLEGPAGAPPVEGVQIRFLELVIDSWDIDLATFGMEIVSNSRFAARSHREFEFVETEADRPSQEEPGLKIFLRDRSLSGDVCQEEIDFPKTLRFKGKRPTALFYYWEQPNLRDPLHFRAP